MKTSMQARICLAVLLTSWLTFIPAAQAQIDVPARLVQVIPLPHIEGWMDHMAVDVKTNRLFLPAQHNSSIEVIDLRTGKVIRSLKGLSGAPRRTVFLPEARQLWLDDAQSVKAFNTDTYEMIKNIPFTLDQAARQVPDNGAYDPVSGLFYICITEDAKATIPGSIEIIDTKTGLHVGSIKVDSTDPSGVAFDASTPRMFVILGDKAQVVVIDREKRVVTATWDITGGPVPHTLAIDTANHRLFIGSRVKPGHVYKPGKLTVMDTDTGKVVQSLDTQGGADEIYYDAANKRVYFTGTTGGIDVFRQVDADHYEPIGTIPTAADAKTSMIVPEFKRLYVAVPRRNVAIPPTRDVITEDAVLLVYEVP